MRNNRITSIKISSIKEIIIIIVVTKEAATRVIIAINQGVVAVIAVVIGEDSLHLVIKAIIRDMVAAIIETTTGIGITMEGSLRGRWSRPRRKCK